MNNSCATIAATFFPMRSTMMLLRTPLIKFVGKRTYGAADHAVRPHPEAPSGVVPSASTSSSAGASSSVEGGSFSTNDDLSARFRYTPLSESEVDNINSGGAAVIF